MNSKLFKDFARALKVKQLQILTIDEITNYIMDEFVRGKITTSDTDTDEDDEMYTKIWNNINAMINGVS